MTSCHHIQGFRNGRMAKPTGVMVVGEPPLLGGHSWPCMAHVYHQKTSRHSTQSQLVRSLSAEMPILISFFFSSTYYIIYNM